MKWSNLPARYRRLSLSIALALAVVFLTFASMRVGGVFTADTTPQGVTAASNSLFLTMNGVTRTADAVSSAAALTGPYFGMADCFFNGSYLNGTPTSAVTVSLDSSADGSNWYSNQSMVIITNSTVFSRAALYGYYTRVSATSFQTNVNPITGTVLCTLKNLNSGK